MKKITKLLMFPLLATTMLTSCSKGEQTTSSTSTSSDSYDVNIYYYTKDNSVFDAIWTWDDEVDNSSVLFKNMAIEEDVTVADCDITFSKIGFSFDTEYTLYSDWGGSTESVIKSISKEDFVTPTRGFILRTSDGGTQTNDLILDTTLFNGDIYYVDGEVYYSPEDIQSIKLYGANYGYTINNQTNKGVRVYKNDTSLKLTKDDLQIREVTSKTNVEIEEIVDEFSTTTILPTDYLDITKKYEVIYTDENNEELILPLSMQKFYSSQTFEDMYTPTEDVMLGAVFTENLNEVTFRLWAPIATDVKLYIKNPTEQTYRELQMTKSTVNKGCYEVTTDAYDGSLYHYSVTNYGETKTNIVDPYAYSVTLNATDGVVVDFTKHALTVQQVETSNSISSAKPTIYEMHVKDFSSSDTFETENPQYKGTFKALIDKTAFYTKENSEKQTIGYNYLLELKEKGLTHVQLMPVYDFKSVDETDTSDEYMNATSNGGYNWGYDPYNYNSLEGSYAYNKEDPLARIDEFKEVVTTYNSDGIGVTMDVVYNHIPSKTNSNFDNIVPDYYFRTSNGSGAGSDMNATRSMFARYIADSTCHYVSHYGVQGFRFDLMGLIDLDTMEMVSSKVHEINPNALIYGEGWEMFDYKGNEEQLPEQNYIMATQGNLSRITDPNSYVGAFNDAFRDAVKGNVFNAEDKGFAQYSYEGFDMTDAVSISNFIDLRDKIIFGITNSNPSRNFLLGNKVYTPYSTSNMLASVNYVECHDNLTVYDKYLITAKDESIAKKLSEISNALTMFTNGISFIQAGQEFFRSKEITDNERFMSDQTVISNSTKSIINNVERTFVHNSYNTGVEVNAIDWSLLAENYSQMKIFDQLQLRSNLPSYSSFDEMYANMNFFVDSSNTAMNSLGLTKEEYLKSICFSTKDPSTNKTYYVLMNFSDKTITPTVNGVPTEVEPLSYKIV